MNTKTNNSPKQHGSSETALYRWSPDQPDQMSVTYVHAESGTDHAEPLICSDETYRFLEFWLKAALKEMSSADSDEYTELIKAYMNNRCCDQEVYAATLHLLSRYDEVQSVMNFLLMNVLVALEEMGMPHPRRYKKLVDYILGGGRRTKAVIAKLMAEDEVLFLLRSDTVEEEVLGEGRIPAMGAAKLVLNLIDCNEGTDGVPTPAASVIASVVGLVAEAKQAHRSVQHAMSAISDVVESAGMSGFEADFCVSLGMEIGEHFGTIMRSRMDRMVSLSPWFVGLKRPRTASEMMQGGCPDLVAA